MPKCTDTLTVIGSHFITSDELVEVLRTNVHAGSVTTYAEVSQWAYGIRTRNHPVRALLRGAVSKGHQVLTNRVVKASGALAVLPEGTTQQLAQLQAEGVPVNEYGNVDFKRTKPVSLGRFLSSESAA